MAIVIIGAGFAGASVAWWLARLGVKNVVVLEREEMPGLHASGVNASMAREFEEDTVISPLAEEGAEFIRKPPNEFSENQLVELSGSLLLSVNEVKSAKMPKRSKVISKKDAVKKVPFLEAASFDNALWSPNDCVIDIHSYLWSFINGAKSMGAKFLLKREIKGFKSTNSKINVVETNQGDVAADLVVNAAGAWSQDLALMAGGEDLKIVSYRRHLYCTPQMREVDPKWPFVWDVKNEYYFRPESGGLLLGPADEEPSRPCIPQINPKMREVLAEKLIRYCPSVANVSIAKEWCGLRTFTPDRRPVVRFDESIKNLFWISALGGRGVTCAASVGRIAAEEIKRYESKHLSQRT